MALLWIPAFAGMTGGWVVCHAGEGRNPMGLSLIIEMLPLNSIFRKETAMNEKEKYRTQMDIRLAELGETLNEIKTKMERRKENTPDIQIETTLRKHEDAKTRLKVLKQADENSWQTYKTELDNLVNDIDDDMRQALVYFG